MKTLVMHDKDNIYAPASDDCWVRLAKAMMTSYSRNYTVQIVTSARTQAEYDTIDKKRYAPARRSILRCIKHGPLKSVVDMTSTFSALENLRKNHMRNCEVFWEDTFNVDLTNL